MSVGIKIENSRDVRIIDCSFESLETGVDIAHSVDVSIDNTHLNNVGTGVKARKVKGLKASRCSETNDVRFKLSIISILVHNYIETLKRNK